MGTGRILVAVDPGERVGWARFVDGDHWQLEACGVMRLAVVSFEPGDELVIEVPRYQPHSNVDPNDIIRLAMKAGQLIERCTPHFGTIDEVTPQMWKGSLSKDICAQRVVKLLNERERTVLYSSPAWMYAYRHNMLDAVGIGLFKLGRFR